MATLGVHWVEFFFSVHETPEWSCEIRKWSFINIIHHSSWWWVVNWRNFKFGWTNCPFKAVPDFIILQFEAIFCDLGEKKIPSRSVSMDWSAANKVGGVQITSFPRRCFPNKRGGEVLLADDVSETFDCSPLYTCVFFFSCHDAVQL